ncbi:ankyrin repeat-containing protein [Babesia ovis]|uniref:Ankyrin repeat-containing protein n=1 Tax=Babesia ovis TaxID=5869 RepID=A0A9W5TE60_BABOV|nr:ankyrin repeat-containing protein [Babesia ovis]
MEILEPIRRALRRLINWRANRQELVDEFKECCQLVAIKRAGGDLKDDDFWNLYGYFKQTVVGDFNIKDTSDATEVEIRKWSSWKRHTGMSKREAMAAYVAIVRQLFGYDDKDGDLSTMANMPSGHKMSFYSHESDPDDDGLFSLVVSGDVPMIESLLEDKPELVNVRSPEGLTALHLAADRGHIKVVKCLLKYGADMNAVDDNNDTPLLVAAAAGNRPVVDLLLRGGADGSVRNIDNLCVDDMLQEGKT